VGTGIYLKGGLKEELKTKDVVGEKSDKERICQKKERRQMAANILRLCIGVITAGRRNERSVEF